MDNKSSRKRCSKKDMEQKIVEHPMLENISTTSLFAKEEASRGAIFF